MLVHDARAVMGEPLDEAAGCLRLVGTAVEASDGRFLGRVRPPPFLSSFLFYSHRGGRGSPHDPMDAPLLRARTGAGRRHSRAALRQAVMAPSAAPARGAPAGVGPRCTGSTWPRVAGDAPLLGVGAHRRERAANWAAARPPAHPPASHHLVAQSSPCVSALPAPCAHSLPQRWACLYLRSV